MMFRLVLILTLALGAAGCTKKAPVQARDVLSRQLLDSVSGPMMLTDFTARNISVTMRPNSRNGSVTTWESRDKASVSFDRGVLIATRGLGEDLMSSDVSATLRMLSGRTGDGYYKRFQTYLDGEYQTRFRSFQCRKTAVTHEVIRIYERNHSTTRTEETCFSPGIEITNTYWRGSDGIMWKSRQWVSPSVEYLETERLLR